jgi:heptaprenyl diphosphate synthase
MNRRVVRLRAVIFLATLTAAGAAVSTAESLLPWPVPWIRLGLANAFTLLALLLHGFRPALGVAVLRPLAASFARGGFLGPAFLLSLGGSLASTAVMGILARMRVFSPVGISIGGAFTHTLTQFLLVSILAGEKGGLMRMAPPFLVIAVISGAAVGWVAMATARHLPREDEGPEA